MPKLKVKEQITKIRAKKAKDTRLAVLLFGEPGSGKTRTVAELINRERYVLILHCGLGMPGIKTIKAYLQAKGRNPDEVTDEYLRIIHITNEEQVKEICKYGVKWIHTVLEDDQEFLSKLDLLVIEEFNGAQGIYERSLVPEIGGIPRQTEVRVHDKDKGAEGTYGHYANLKMGTEYIIFKLMGLPFDQVWTAHEDADQKHIEKNSGIAPWVQTRALVGFMGAFPFSIRTCKAKKGFKPAGQTQSVEADKYFYRLAGEMYTKAQIENCPPRIGADPAKLWDLILGDTFQSLKVVSEKEKK